MLKLESKVSLKEFSGASLQVVLPWSDEETGAYIWVIPSLSSVSRSADHQFFRQKVYDTLSDKVDNDKITQISSRISGWSGIQVGEDCLEYSEENKYMLLSKYDWLIPQILEKIRELDEFSSNLITEATEFANWQFKMGSRQKDGASLQQHMEKAQASPFAAPALIQAIEDEVETAPMLPEAAAFVWSFFLKLHQQRPSGGMGVSCLSFTDIDSFCRLTKMELESFELDLILAFDRCFLTSYYEQQEKEHKAQNKK